LAYPDASKAFAAFSGETVMGVDVEVHLLNMKKYRDEFLPPYNSFMESGETRHLASLLNRVIDELPEKSSQLELTEPKETYENYLDILEGRESYAPGAGATRTTETLKTDPRHLREFVRSNVGPSIAYVICSEVRPGIPSCISMTRTKLVRYLYEHSHWVAEIFSFSRQLEGPALAVPLGESTELLTNEEALRFYEEVVGARRPGLDAELQEEYDGLVALLRAATQNPDLSAAIVVI
jgi:hypothetical protein